MAGYTLSCLLLRYMRVRTQYRTLSYSIPAVHSARFTTGETLSQPHGPHHGHEPGLAEGRHQVGGAGRRKGVQNVTCSRSNASVTPPQPETTRSRRTHPRQGAAGRRGAGKEAAQVRECQRGGGGGPGEASTTGALVERTEQAGRWQGTSPEGLGGPSGDCIGPI